MPQYKCAQEKFVKPSSNNYSVFMQSSIPEKSFKLHSPSLFKGIQHIQAQDYLPYFRFLFGIFFHSNQHFIRVQTQTKYVNKKKCMKMN